ncbi:hypothetical protein GCM10022237_02130 [Nocardioides ginsengisoli]|uniref:Alpha/beta hydrolase n=1 Tax=Nocardioides ginsengisoli TaxID=363868 RepID=A0ABW3W6M9_9ACTN
MTSFAEPVVLRRGGTAADAPVVVLLHGRGADEMSIMALADHLPAGPEYVAVRAPIAEGGGFAWFANRGIGRPVAESLAETMSWFREWLDAELPAGPDGRKVVLVGFSGGAAFAGGLILSDPSRYAGVAILYGTLPFDAGVPITPGRLTDTPMFVAQGETDTVIPRELLDATWHYLTTDAHPRTATWREPGGHLLTAEAAAALNAWLTAVLG